MHTRTHTHTCTWMHVCVRARLVEHCVCCSNVQTHVSVPSKKQHIPPTLRLPNHVPLKSTRAMCRQTHTRTCMHAHARTHMHTHTHARTQTQKCMCTCIVVHMCKHARVWVCTCAHVNVHRWGRNATDCERDRLCEENERGL